MGVNKSIARTPVGHGVFTRSRAQGFQRIAIDWIGLISLRKHALAVNRLTERVDHPAEPLGVGAYRKRVSNPDPRAKTKAGR